VTPSSAQHVSNGRPFLGWPVLLLTVLLVVPLAAQRPAAKSGKDSLERIKLHAEQAEFKTAPGKQLRIIVQNVDISKFPQITLICEMYPGSDVNLDTLRPENLFVRENNIEKQVVSIAKIQQGAQVPVDFIFLVDVTGTMQGYINDIKANVRNFTNSLQQRGIDYRLGLITFTDIVETVNQPIDDVSTFLNWLELLKANGGFDEKENALEALAELKRIKFRPAANRVAVLVTDAPYHQSGEGGSGVTSHTTNTMIRLMNSEAIKTFCIVRPEMDEYTKLTRGTKGALYNINHPFAQILDNYSTQITNLYAITYRSDAATLKKDSINVSILDENKRELVQQRVPIVEIGRKFIIENLLFKTNSADLPDTVEELDVLIKFMKQRPTVRIRVEGHTDNVGSMAVNNALSKRRADSVRDYLIRKGVSAERIESQGFGPSKPIASNGTEFGRRLNRRTEIVITAK
jgi:outer membrane protein OmpA-like peptidoglycan-associated protein